MAKPKMKQPDRNTAAKKPESNTSMKQLKKSNFLAAMTVAAMSRADIVDALDEYDFLPSWLDYLIEHFMAQGKIIKEQGEKGEALYHTKASKAAASRQAFLIKDGEKGGFIATVRKLGTGEGINKEIGEGTTLGRAIKNRTSAIFARYKEDCTTVRALKDIDEKSIVVIDETADKK